VNRLEKPGASRGGPPGWQALSGDPVALCSSERRLQYVDEAAGHRGHIEAKLVGARPAESRAFLGQPSDGKPPDPSLFGSGHRLDRHPVRAPRAALDLAEDQGLSPSKNKVKLAFTASPVAGHDLVAARLVPFRSERLACGCERLATVPRYG
jgi:hypothetical protein